MLLADTCRFIAIGCIRDIGGPDGTSNFLDRSPRRSILVKRERGLSGGPEPWAGNKAGYSTRPMLYNRRLTTACHQHCR